MVLIKKRKELILYIIFINNIFLFRINKFAGIIINSGSFNLIIKLIFYKHLNILNNLKDNKFIFVLNKLKPDIINIIINYNQKEAMFINKSFIISSKVYIN